ncbi:MAG TPA: hypothetical protein VK922_01325 [Gemmatimonadaceae bacterium]|nr:hypothetical protein [Gemmatimonadaceae bacterium]
MNDSSLPGVDTTPVDWNEELRKIEREFDGLPPEPTPAELRARYAEQQRRLRERERRAGTIGVWVRLLLVAGLAAALFAWPYARACGPGLLAYMGAGAVVIIGALWTVFGTWRLRLAKTHGLALLLLLWGLTFIAAQVLPRVGYALSDPASPESWRCVNTAPARIGA